MRTKDKLNVIIIEDGSCMQDCFSFKVDIMFFIKKYHIEPPQNISQLPEYYLKLDRKFKKRALRELLELCNEKLSNNKKNYLALFTMDGILLERIDEITDD